MRAELEIVQDICERRKLIESIRTNRAEESLEEAIDEKVVVFADRRAGGMAENPTAGQASIGSDQRAPGVAVVLADGPAKDLVAELLAELLATMILLGLLAALVGESGERHSPDVHRFPQKPRCRPPLRRRLSAYRGDDTPGKEGLATMA